MSRPNQDVHDGAADLFASWAEQPPRAAHFIVTIYGDVVEPRGGILWMGTLIEICEVVGLSESLVRTAVSRLVAAGQLIGERSGRRSYYRLTDQAQEEFAAAARVLFSAPVEHESLLFVVPRDPDARVPAGFVRVGPDLLVGTTRPGAKVPDGLAFRADVMQGAADFPSFAARCWNLDRHAAAYRRVLDRFTPLMARLAGGARLSPQDSLVARLLLVDDFREATLEDPGLPAAALPADWPGEAARTLFAGLYFDLSGLADSHISAHFRDEAGLLAASTSLVRARLANMADVRKRHTTAKTSAFRDVGRPADELEKRHRKPR